MELDCERTLRECNVFCDINIFLEIGMFYTP